jgi:hypothetical protein
MFRARRHTSIVAALLACTAPLGAQVIRVRALDETSGRPLDGAIADVLDARGRLAVQGLLGADGVRLLPLPDAGTFSVRVRRIGFEPFTSAPVEVRVTDTVEVALRVPLRRVLLSRLTVTGDRRCARDVYAGGGVALLLEEARKALTATALGRAESLGGTALDARTFDRELDGDGRTRTVRVGFPHRVGERRPFTASSAAALSDSGYVRMAGGEVTYYGPDEEVLASDEFVRDHCFEISRGEGSDPRLVGVRFTPTPGRRVSDIAGTLWIDSTTAELRYVDFWHEGASLPRRAGGPPPSGGQVVFERAATGGTSGRWIVSAWHLRMPRYDGLAPARGITPTGFIETGGVVSLAGEESRPAVVAPYLELLRPARLSGVVFDSIAGRPLAGAQVWLEPRGVVAPDRLAVSRAEATTDSAGRYVLDSLPAGSYRLGVDEPRLDAAGVPLPRYDIQLQPGMAVDGALAVPSRATLARGCQQAVGEPHDGLLFGTVRTADGGSPVKGAAVRLSWGVGPAPRRDVVAWTDDRGTYRACGVPAGVPVTAQAFGGGVASGWMDLRLDDLRLLRRDVFLPIPPAGGRSVPGAKLRGIVRDSAERPVAGARVTLDDWPGTAGVTEARSATTGADGRFALDAVPPGTQSGVVTMTGHAPLRFVTELRSLRTTEVELVVDGAHAAPTMRDLLAALPDVQLYHAPPQPLTPGHLPPGRWAALARRGAGVCPMRVEIDGRVASADEMMALDPAAVRGAEALPDAACGVVRVATR